MTSDRPCRVRLTDDAVADVVRLHRKDPAIVRTLVRKMLLLERSPEAGEPLLGALVGFRKLTAGNRDWRIVWRVTEDDQHTPVLDIAEVWAAGARSDGEVYAELTRRVGRAQHDGDVRVRALASVVQEMGRLWEGVEPAPEPIRGPALPEWLARGLAEVLRLSEDQIASLSEEEAQQRLAAHWSRPRGS
ncbi:type II toxin-antitoxin system RelE/ParE family toxin [Curtobacterium herbarum]|uniref:type II toxin-antitoxin system RelE/ParE family toxin n=1 Tax=Curtobacterium herbarum TaxID=150122 RepID=UPI001C8F03DB|nr:type II toxin-antitoxin system RelE/ParE family toxin [Curtobacterium herbarum]MBY0175076.1 type II toxin-antitoxin system RelE/ParE family toxin [Curtobacterium herbarum]